ncbi:MAG: cytochrome P450 [Microlunatus sp.]|nr:cytochrome P450 [Microlunatus sp.]
MTVSAGGCPVRKLVPPDERSGPPVERIGGPDGERWVFRSFELVRSVLREESAFHQAGFGADGLRRASMRPPILYLEGPAHRAQRRGARLFTPKITEGYRPMVEDLAERLVGRLRSDRATDLTTLSLRMAVEVAARVVGLTNSSIPAMTRRLDTFFDGDPLASRWTPRTTIKLLRTHSATFRFYWLDVKPAIRARRRHPDRTDDVISQLVERDFTDLEILTECLTYGAAGMVTTREFITVAAWHLLDDPALLARFRAGDRQDRLAIVNEALRLEPVVGHLLRRADRTVTLPGPDGPIAVAAGDLVDLDIRAANTDAATIGEAPLELRPDRSLPRAVPATVLSFGDGNHRCPGAPIAIMETEIFLSSLFARDVVATGPPRVRWNPVTLGYDLDQFDLRLAPPETSQV